MSTGEPPSELGRALWLDGDPDDAIELEGGEARALGRDPFAEEAGADPLLARLDAPAPDPERSEPRLVLVPLRHADAVTTADALLLAVDDRGGELEVWPDARTNRLVVRGRPEAVARARAFIDRIDRPSEGTGRLQVVPVRYSDPDRVAEILDDDPPDHLSPAVDRVIRDRFPIKLKLEEKRR